MYQWANNDSYRRRALKHKSSVGALRLDYSRIASLISKFISFIGKAFDKLLREGAVWPWRELCHTACSTGPHGTDVPVSRLPEWNRTIGGAGSKVDVFDQSQDYGGVAGCGSGRRWLFTI